MVMDGWGQGGGENQNMLSRQHLGHNFRQRGQLTLQRLTTCLVSLSMLVWSILQVQAMGGDVAVRRIPLVPIPMPDVQTVPSYPELVSCGKPL